MATFFGEVNEISSRAVWWSDSEEEEEEEVDQDATEDDKPKKSSSSKPTVSYQTEILDDQRWTTFQKNAQLLYVSLGKGGKTPPLEDHRLILRVKVDALVGGGKKAVSGNIASLFHLPEGNYWLLVDNKLANAAELAIFCPRLVDYLASEVLLCTATRLDLLLISKELSRWNFVQYISGSGSSSSMTDRLAQLAKVVDLRPMLPPATVKNDLELALLEYCIVISSKKHQKFNFALLLLPSEYAETLNFLPKAVIASVVEFTFFSHLNIV